MTYTRWKRKKPDVIKKMLERVESFLLLLLLTLIICLVGLQILSRVSGYSVQWSEEITRYIFVWMVFLGAAAGIRTDSHIGAEFFGAMLSEKNQLRLKFFHHSIFFIFLALTFYFSIPFIRMQRQFGQSADTLPIPMFLITSIIPVACVLGLAHLIEALWTIRHELRKRTNNSSTST
ncbi:TRAP transporter small permease subunit [candidate division KSB3 bacterium]|uniref:TRAP transporter small permease subunit n=1 Tax=candidate division KSB3 bacterium TaxID=2044937 RepID=A0A9D5Q7K3_9BACT|nr:TRAP transporter small permease subunit [candidate division KSB3 bacterium]MBD3326533.1 TRAP transporter small permease subunit [candidate division KSB3 bacterium]